MHAGEGGGGRSATTSPDGVSLRSGAGFDFVGAGVQPIHDHGRQEEPDQVPAPSLGAEGEGGLGAAGADDD